MISDCGLNKNGSSDIFTEEIPYFPDRTRIGRIRRIKTDNESVNIRRIRFIRVLFVIDSKHHSLSYP